MHTNGTAPHRIAIWTPWPPQQSGIADYSVQLVRHLVCLNEYEIEVFVDDSCFPLSGPVSDLSVYRFSEYAARHAARPFDLSIYHMGNNHKYHGQIYGQLLCQPGITILHDISLADFYFSLSKLSGQYQAFLDEIEFNYGQDTRASMQQMLAHRIPFNGTPYNRIDVTITRRIVERSFATVVHSAWACTYLKTRYPASTIVHVPEAAPIHQLDLEQVRHIRAQLGWTAEQFVIGVFGGLQRIKRLHVVIEAFQQLHERFPGARLLIAGYAGSTLEDIYYLQQITARIHATGLHDAVHIATNLPEDDLQAYIATVDLIVNLRWPSAGETSAIMMRAFGAGKVVITSDIPQIREYDQRYCRRVPVPSGEQPEATIDSLDAPAHEVECLTQLLVKTASQRDDLAAAGAAARDFMQAHSSWEKSARAYREVIERTLMHQASLQPGTPLLAAKATATRATGVNVIGDVMVADGLGEATRTTMDAIMKRKIPVSYSELPYGFPERYPHYKERFAALPEGSIFPVNLLLYNLHVLPQVPAAQLQALTAGKYTIGLWFWELGQIPDQFLSSFERVDEIWVSSRYTQASMLTVAKTPVAVIPCPVEVITSPRIDRSFFGIPDRRYVFLFNFAATSCNARKNPLGVIRAFERAFGRSGGSGPLLVLKVHFLDYFPAYRRMLHEAVERVGGILLEQSYTREQMNTLLACADAYISLHRSEGFGLGIAESMYLGKPVIATNYSGNTDFMTPQNSYLVDYDLRAIQDQDHDLQPECNDIYRSGQIWAEPNIEQAATWMWHLVQNQEEGRQRGERAAADIRRYCSPAVVGEMIERRLQAIEREQVPLQMHATVTSLHRQIVQQKIRLSTHWRPEDRNEIAALYRSAAQAQLQMAQAYFGFMAESLDGLLQQASPDTSDVPADQPLRQQLASLQASIWNTLGCLEQIRPTVDPIQPPPEHPTGAPGEPEGSGIPALLEQQLHATREAVDEQLRNHLEAIDERLRDHLETTGEQLYQHLSTTDQKLHNHLTTTDGKLHDHLDAANGHLQASRETLERAHRDMRAEMEARLEPVEEQGRFHTGQIRYLLDAQRDAESDVHPLAGENLIRLLTLLERDRPELAQASHASITIQNGHYAASTEPMIVLAAQYFGERLTQYGQRNTVWYHVDYTENWQRTILFQNAHSKLDIGGWLVIMTDSSFTQPVAAVPPAKLALCLDRVYPVAPGIATRVCIWQRQPD